MTKKLTSQQKWNRRHPKKMKEINRRHRAKVRKIVEAYKKEHGKEMVK